MWVDEENNQDPYGRTTPAAGTNENTSVGAGGGTAGAPASSSGTASNPSTQTPTQSSQPTQNFGTVQDYLKGNQQQGEALGAQFTGDLAANQTNEKSAIDTAAKQTTSDINAGTTNYNAGLVNQAVSDPTKVTGNPDQLQSFLGQWNAAYSGPSSFETSANYAPAQAAATEATTKGTEESTAGGQQQLLHDNYGVYGQGNQGLDQAVLQNSSYEPQVQQQAASFQTIPTYLQSQATGLDTAATTAAANTAATQAQTKAAFANEPQTFQTEINNEVTAAQNTAATQAKQYQADLASGDPAKITADLQAANPSADPSTIQQYLASMKQDYATTPDLSGQYSFNPATAITAANTATAADYANAAAYGQLTGTDYSGILNQNNVAQAGTAPTAGSALNTPQLQTYLKGQLDTKDQSTLQTPFTTDAIYNNKMDATGASQLAQQYVDAATRQGVAYKDSSTLQDMLGKATTAMQGALAGGLPANNPQVQAYKAIVDKLSAYANAPTTSTAPSTVQTPTAPPINISTPGAPTPTNRSGTTTTPVTPTTLTTPQPIKGLTPDTVSQSVLKSFQQQIAAAPVGVARRNLEEGQAQAQSDAKQLQDLYQTYMKGAATAQQYVQMQQLLKKYKLA